MKKLSKFLSIVFTMVIALTLAVPAFAVTTIDRVDITIDSDLIGKTPNQWATYISTTTENVTINPYGLCVYDYTAGKNPGDNEAFVEGHNYNIVPCVKVNSGYAFDTENIKVYLNGNSYTDFYFSNDNGLLCINYSYRHLDSSAKEIKRVDITFDNEIAGKTLWDFEDYFTFNTSNVSYYADSEMGAADIYDYETESYLKYDTKLVKGEEYDFELYMLADKGYYFIDDLEVYVNGNKIDGEDFYTYVSTSESFNGQDVLCVELTETVEKQPSFFVKLFRAIGNFFASIFGGLFK